MVDESLSNLESHVVLMMIYFENHFSMTDLMFGMDPTVPGSTFQNRTVHPCEKICDIIDDGAQRLCGKYCTESESWEYGFFDMADPAVAHYINAIGRSVFISQVSSGIFMSQI